MLLIAKPILVAPRLSNKIHNIFQKMSMLRSDKKSKTYYLQLKGISKFIYVFFIINYVII